MTENQIGFSDIVNECVSLLREHFGFVLLVTTVIAAGSIVLDLLNENVNIVVGGLIVGVFVQYLFTEKVLVDLVPEGLSEKRRKYGALFAASILGTLGIVFGFVLLIVPGLILMSGWSAATPFIVVERKGGIEALKSSWRATSPARVPLALVFLVYCLAIAVLLGIFAFQVETSGADGEDLMSIIMDNVFSSIMYVSNWLLGSAVYRLVAPRGNELANVFS